MNAILEAMNAATEAAVVVVLVEVRNVYGKPTIYPANDAAQRLAEIAGAKTLQPRHLALARGLGLRVEEVTPARLGQVA